MVFTRARKKYDANVVDIRILLNDKPLDLRHAGLGLGLYSVIYGQPMELSND